MPVMPLAVWVQKVGGAEGVEDAGGWGGFRGHLLVLPGRVWECFVVVMVDAAESGRGEYRADGHVRITEKQPSGSVKTSLQCGFSGLVLDT